MAGSNNSARRQRSNIWPCQCNIRADLKRDGLIKGEEADIQRLDPLRLTQDVNRQSNVNRNSILGCECIGSGYEPSL